MKRSKSKLLGKTSYTNTVTEKNSFSQYTGENSFLNKINSIKKKNQGNGGEGLITNLLRRGCFTIRKRLP